MPTDPNVNLNPMLGLSVAPLSVAHAYLSQLERGSIHSLQSHDRAMSRALNTFNTLWFNLGLDAVSASRNAVRRAWADAGVRHDEVRKVMDICARAGLWRIKFAAIKEQAKKAGG